MSTKLFLALSVWVIAAPWVSATEARSELRKRNAKGAEKGQKTGSSLLNYERRGNKAKLNRDLKAEREKSTVERSKLGEDRAKSTQNIADSNTANSNNNIVDAVWNILQKLVQNIKGLKSSYLISAMNTMGPIQKTRVHLGIKFIQSKLRKPSNKNIQCVRECLGNDPKKSFEVPKALDAIAYIIYY
jgi:hypothetical protein